jgi:hypothetical protein
LAYGVSFFETDAAVTTMGLLVRMCLSKACCGSGEAGAALTNILIALLGGEDVKIGGIFNEESKRVVPGAGSEMREVDVVCDIAHLLVFHI